MHLLAAVLLSAAPVANIVDWIAADLHNTRYLYQPSIWIFLLIAAAARGTSWGPRWLLFLALLNAIGAIYNVRSYVWVEI